MQTIGSFSDSGYVRVNEVCKSFFACSSRDLATTVDDYVDVQSVLSLYAVLVHPGPAEEAAATNDTIPLSTLFNLL